GARYSDCSRCCSTCSDSKITQIRTLFLHDCRDGGHCSPHGVFYRNNGSVLDSCEHRLVTSASLFAVSQRQIAASRARARKSRILCISRRFLPSVPRAHETPASSRQLSKAPVPLTRGFRFCAD